MMVVADLMAKLGLDTSAFDRGLDGVTRNRGLANLGGQLTRSITLPIAAAGAVSVKMAADFEASMTLIQTQAGGTAKDVKFLSDAVLNMKDVQHGPKELADSLYHLKSVGMDNAHAMDALTASEHLASVGGSDLETTTNAVASAFKSGISGAQNFNQAAATINATIGAGNLRLEDYVSAMGTGIMVNAKQAGASLTDVGAAIAMLTSRGIPATRAAMSLKMAFAAMAAPTDKMSKVLDDIGLKQFDLANAIRKGGLPAAVNLLKDHLDGLSKTAQTADLTKMFGAKSSQAILTLIANTKDYARVQKQIVDNATSGAFQKAIEAQGEDAAAKWKEALANLSKAAVRIGDVLLPAAANIATAVGKVAGALDELGPAGTTAVVAFAGVLAAAGPVLTIMSKISMLRMGKALSGLGGGVPVVVPGGAGAAAAGGGGAAAGGAAAKGLGTVAVRFVPAAGAAAGITTIFVTGLDAGLKQAAANSTAKKSFWQDFFSTSGAILTGPGDWFSKLMGNDKPFLTKVQQDVKNAAEATGDAMSKLGAKAATATGPAFDRIREEMTNIQKLTDKGFEFGDIKGKHTDSQLRSIRDRIMSTLHVTKKQADTIMASLFKDWRPQNTVMPKINAAMAAAEARMDKMRANANRQIQMGNVNNTALINSISQVTGAFNNMGSAARTAGDAAVNALSHGSYRGHFAGATGAVVTRPTFALIGESGPEAVVPLNTADGASALSGSSRGSDGSSNVTNLTFGSVSVVLPPGDYGDSEDAGSAAADAFMQRTREIARGY